MMKVCLIFRCKNDRSFSIEKVFEEVSLKLKNFITVVQEMAPERSATVPSVCKNIVYLRKLKADVFHVTGDIHYAVFSFPGKRTVLTVHDCGFMQQPSWWRRLIFRKLWLEWPIKHAALVTAISKKTKAEILLHVDCPPDKIRVVYNPLPTHLRESSRAFNDKAPVFLFIGTKPNKNLDRTVAALKGLPGSLVVIGHLNSDQVRMLKEADLQWENRYALTDAEMADCYDQCDVLLFPSLYEGFGLPVIEAQFCNKPVVASRIEPIIEIAGDAACLIDPLSVSSMREGILKVLNDQAYRLHLITEGKKNTARFSADAIADQYKSIYEELH